jgi:hypothetical protein
MKFIADAMLGRLARWLRLLGLDTLYYPDVDDGRLLKIARQEGRTLLTRDTRLAERAGAGGSLLIASDDPAEQLRQAFSDLGLRQSAKGRCVDCNGPLEDVGRKEEVRGLVPEHVYLSHARFERCLGCGHLYWEGTQQRRFREMLSGMVKSMGGGEA